MTPEALRAGIRRSIIPLSVLLGFCWSADARAEDKIADARADETAADALMSEAKLLMEQKRYTEACPKLEQSQRLDPSGERILELARCHKEQGRIATAYYELREAFEIAQRDRRWERVKAARTLLEELEPNLPKLSISVGTKVASLPGFEIHRDGTKVRRQEWSTPFPVDPGRHAVLATAPGYKSFIKTVNVNADGALVDVVIDALESTESPTVSRPRPSFQIAPPAGSDSRASTWSIQKKIGLTVGGVGVAALGLGAVLGVQASGARREAETRCSVGGCTPDGARARDRADTFGSASAMAFIGGGLATAGGLLLFVTAPPPPSEQEVGLSSIGVGPTGVWANGRW